MMLCWAHTGGWHPSARGLSSRQFRPTRVPPKRPQRSTPMRWGLLHSRKEADMREALRGVGLALRDQVPWRTVATIVIVAVMIFALGFLIVYMVAKIDSVANT